MEDLKINTNAQIIIPKPFISIIIFDEEGRERAKKIMLTRTEMLALKKIVETKTKSNKSKIDSETFESLMNKKLIYFSARFKYVVATDMIEKIIETKKSNGALNMWEEDNEIAVSWGNFCA